MRAKELANLLLQNPEFEVKCVVCDTSICSPEHPYPECNSLDICGVADINYSNKIIVLDTE